MNNEINFNEVTIQDCIDAYVMKGLITVVNDGKVVEIVKE